MSSKTQRTATALTLLGAALGVSVAQAAPADTLEKAAVRGEQAEGLTVAQARRGPASRQIKIASPKNRRESRQIKLDGIADRPGASRQIKIEQPRRPGASRQIKIDDAGIRRR